MDIKKVLIIGAGQMGSGIAQVMAQGGIEVMIRDIKEEFVEKGIAGITKRLARSVEKGKITEEEKEAILTRISGTVELGSTACDVDLVVEAAIESGSLITARLAAEQGREVFAIPGSIHSPQARGCHKLIKQGAKLIETAEDVLEELRWSSPLSTSPSSGMSSNESNELLSLIGFDPCAVDELSVRSGMSADVLSVMLLHLELEGQIARLPGGFFQRLSLA